MNRNFSDEELHLIKMFLGKIEAQFTHQARVASSPILTAEKVIKGLSLAYAEAIEIKELPKTKISFRPFEEMVALCNFDHISELILQGENLIERIGEEEDSALFLVDFKIRISSSQNIAVLLDTYNLAPATLAELLAFRRFHNSEFKVVALGTNFGCNYPKIKGNDLTTCFAAEGNSGIGHTKFLAKPKAL